MSGIVIQDNKWETIAIPAAAEVSLPYALGITMVFKPSGIATEQTAQVTVESGNGRKRNTAMAIAGNSSSRAAEII